MKTKTYIIDYTYQGKYSNGSWWFVEHSYAVEANSKAEAREKFDEWHEKHGAIRDYRKGQPIRRHPFYVKITIAD